MKHRLWHATVASLICVQLAALPTQPAEVRAGPPSADRPLRIWAAGDSFAAGEGLRAVQVGEERCQRALGLDAGAHNPPSKAWPVLVKETFENGNVSLFNPSRSDRWTVDTFWFTACTGATSTTVSTDPTNHGTTQLAEIEATDESTMFDVTTMSFGGNDIGFADTIKDCIGVDWDLVEADALAWGLVPALGSGVGAGCTTTEQQLKDRIKSNLVDGGQLDTLYNTMAAHTSPGGLIVVAGYPQLFATPETWSAKEKAINRCNRVSEGDVRALRGATGALNQTIGEAVNQAQGRHPDRTWVFVDIAGTFEAGPIRANLCGNIDAINGFAWNATRNGQGDGSKTSGFARSYHPNQIGHQLYAKAVINAILASGWTPVMLHSPIEPAEPVAELDVVFAQTLLNVVGFGPLAADGVFGPASTAAMTAFQRRAGLPATGVLDAETWDRLLAEAAKQTYVTTCDPDNGFSSTVVRPSLLRFSCPGLSALVDLEWSTWSPLGAAGTGLMVRPCGGAECTDGPTNVEVSIEVELTEPEPLQCGDAPTPWLEFAEVTIREVASDWTSTFTVDGPYC